MAEVGVAADAVAADVAGADVASADVVAAGGGSALHEAISRAIATAAAARHRGPDAVVRTPSMEPVPRADERRLRGAPRRIGPDVPLAAGAQKTRLRGAPRRIGPDVPLAVPLARCAPRGTRQPCRGGRGVAETQTVD